MWGLLLCLLVFCVCVTGFFWEFLLSDPHGADGQAPFSQDSREEYPWKGLAGVVQSLQKAFRGQESQ